MTIINDYDLTKHKYDIETLIQNINHLYIKTISRRGFWNKNEMFTFHCFSNLYT